MSIFSRFFGKKDVDADRDASLIANPKIKKPLSLQLLFAEKVRISSGDLTKALRAFHSSMANARCEIDPALNNEGKIIGLAGWKKHVIQLVGFDCQMPSQAVETCVAPSHYPQELKRRARAHSSHLLLYYGGYEPSPFEQYVALAAVAGALAQFGAIVVLNESGRTSFPAEALSGSETDGDIMELLRTLPLSILYCGFVKYDLEGDGGVWMRTYGANLMGLPDFAAHARGHEEGQRFFDIFENVFGYLRSSKAQLAAGHTMQIEQEEYLRLREPTNDEYFLESEGTMLVAEIIRSDEINR